MKREIKFRGKRVDNGEWMYGFYYNWQNQHFISVLDDSIADAHSLHHYEVDPETVGQYTGSKDKNGLEIYERDCVKFQQGYIKPTLVYWNIEMTGFYPILSERSIRLEVVGNIIDNPELFNASYECK